MLNPSEMERGALVAELKRVKAKQAVATDKDIQAALNLKVEALTAQIEAYDAAKGASAPTSEAVSDSADARAELELQLKRLKAKHDAVDDADLRSALALSMEPLKERLKKLKADEEAVEPEAPAAPPTPEEKDAADKLVQQARVEKMRGNARGVADLLGEASRIAPGSVEVMELLADELAEQHKYDDAIKTYDKARKLDPKNVNVDRKHANLVFQSKAVGATAAMTMADHEALASSAGRAMLLSVFLPGLGQVVLAQYTKGAVLFCTWFSMILWLFISHKHLEGLLHQIAVSVGLRNPGGETQYSLTIVIPIVVSLIVYAVSIFGCKTAAREASFFSGGGKGGGKVDHPAPPVNLPFE